MVAISLNLTELFILIITSKKRIKLFQFREYGFTINIPIIYSCTQNKSYFLKDYNNGFKFL